MSRPIRHCSQDPPFAPDAQEHNFPIAECPPADAEMARVLRTKPLRMAADPSCGAITYWKHDPVHDVVKPMAEHVIMTYPAGSQRLERRTGKSLAIGTARPRSRMRINAWKGAAQLQQFRDALPKPWFASSDLPIDISVIAVALDGRGEASCQPAPWGAAMHQLRHRNRSYGCPSGSDPSASIRRNGS